MRHRPSYAAIASTAAVVLSLSGTAVAARQYLITSSAQIKPGAVSQADLAPGVQAALVTADPPAGPSVYSAYKPGAVTVPADHIGTVLTIANIPTGNYVLVAKGVFVPSAPGPGHCKLSVGRTHDATGFASQASGEWTGFSLTYAASNVSGPVTLGCDVLNGAQGFVDSLSIVAIQVGAVHATRS
jgi:hypothetical protein